MAKLQRRRKQLSRQEFLRLADKLDSLPAARLLGNVVRNVPEEDRLAQDFLKEIGYEATEDVLVVSSSDVGFSDDWPEVDVHVHTDGGCSSVPNRRGRLQGSRDATGE